MSDNQQFTKLLKILLDKGLFGEDEIDLQESVEYALLQLISVQPRGIDDLITSIDFTKMVNNSLNRLLRKNLITMKDHIYNINSSLFSTIPAPGADLKVSDFDNLLPDFENAGTKKKRILHEIAVPSLPTKPDVEESVEIDDTLSPRERMLRDLASKAPSTSVDNSMDDDLFGDLGDESLGDILGDINEALGDDSTRTSVITPLIDLLKPLGYIDKSLREVEYETVPAYQILRTILRKYPISTEQIESQIESEASLSMLLSNLRADDLISQTNDYRYTLSKKVLKKLKQFIDQNMSSPSSSGSDPDVDVIETNIRNDFHQFKEALHHLGYIDNLELTIDNYLHKPEVEILNIIRENTNKTSEEIKELTNKTVPVVVMRMISRLDADGLITQNSESQWRLSTKFRFYMAKNKLREKLDEERYESLTSKYK